MDGVTSDHFVHGKSDHLCTLLADVYSVALSHGCVPTVFNMGVIVPILKKASLDPNLIKNYHPVRASSIHTKLVELTMVPSADISDNQFGFRDGRSTGMACSMLNDVISYCNEAKSFLYIAALDAEKCFDSVCHFSLFVKLLGVLPDIHWLFLYNRRDSKY